jgi:hypothetical protein
LLSLSGGSRLELGALSTSSKELKPLLDRLTSSSTSGLVYGPSPVALLTEIDKLTLTAADQGQEQSPSPVALLTEIDKLTLTAADQGQEQNPGDPGRAGCVLQLRPGLPGPGRVHLSP